MRPIVDSYTLRPEDSHKSFYNKAFVLIDEQGNTFLQSYSTIVAGYINGEFCKLWNGWTATTARHIKAFASSFDYQGKKHWDNLPCTTDVELPKPIPTSYKVAYW